MISVWSENCIDGSVDKNNNNKFNEKKNKEITFEQVFWLFEINYMILVTCFLVTEKWIVWVLGDTDICVFVIHPKWVHLKQKSEIFGTITIFTPFINQ